MYSFLQRIKKERLYFDGGTGALLSARDFLRAGEPPELLNITTPDAIYNLHLEYLRAGADIIKTNTFGINSRKYDNYKELIERGVSLAVRARDEAKKEGLVALDIGPLGRMLSPIGDLDFEVAVGIFADTVRAAEGLGADLVLIETISDLYEAKAAVLAAKENCSLPVVVTLTFGSDGKLMSGADVRGVVATLEGLGVSALGINCSQGPKEMQRTVESLLEYATVPVVVNPNAGLPRFDRTKTVYDLSPSEFAASMVGMVEMGAGLVGGCCGTTPEYIAALKEATKDIAFKALNKKTRTLVSSSTHAVEIGKIPLLVGERLNPTGKPKVKAALRGEDMTYLCAEALAQYDDGADILDLNTGLADVDEKSLMCRAVHEIQAVCDLPLQIDTARGDVLEAAMRIYCGKPLVNSVNGSEESMKTVFPLVKKYGGVVIALTMDEEGIPESVQGRVDIAVKIVKRAEEWGIDRSELVFDPLALAVASGDDNALVTLGTVKALGDMGLYTSLGVSNVSFGLPARAVLNSAFLSAALWGGLDLAIVNPSSADLMNAYLSYLVLSGKDKGCERYIGGVRQLSESGATEKKSRENSDNITLEEAIVRGLVEVAESECRLLMPTYSAMEVINDRIIPALDRVGKEFEEKRLYLPSLLRSAEAASRAFGVAKEYFPKGEKRAEKTIVLATVKGDIHDIGKNIVKLVFESYGFNVVDLGRDVPAERIVEAAKRYRADIVGLSALMTTTLPAMARTVELLKAECPEAKVVVGGAVLTERYATEIGADFYASDAMCGVRYATKN